MSEHSHDAVVRDSFEQQTALFSGHSSPFAHRAPSPLAWVEPLDPDMVVLDVACGAAHVAEQLAPRVSRVVGVDLTPALLAMGADRLRDAGITNVELQQGNAADLPFADESFDLVVCRGALHHFARRADAIAEMARVCRPGGRVVVSDMVAPSPEVHDRFDEVHRLLDPSHVGVVLEAELAEVLQDAVGPIAYAQTGEPLRLAVDHIFTDVADRDAVMDALRAELSGGPATGLAPTVEGDEISVSFTTAVVHARKASVPGG